jgi:hypothetical protein
MRKLFSMASIAIALVTALVLVGLSVLGPAPALSTVAEAPRLVAAILNGKPISVLYVTRSSDTVLVRCYPGFEPSLTVQVMGGNAPQKEGVLTCVSSS